MSNDSSGLNDTLVETFLQESGEILEGATNAILALGSASNPRPFINQLFRDFHSIKGNAALFGLEHAKTLAHELEDILGELRESDDKVSAELITLLIESRDTLAELLPREIERKISADLTAKVTRLRDELRNVIRSDNSEQLNRLYQLTSDLARRVQGESPELQRLVDEIGQVVRQVCDQREVAPDERIVWPRPYRELRKLVSIAEEDALSEDHRSQIFEQLYALTALANSKDVRAKLKDLCERVGVLMEMQDADDLLAEILREVLEEYAEVDCWIVPEAPPEESAAEVQERSADPAHARTMRVPEYEIDKFLSYVGELIVVSDMFRTIQEQFKAGVDSRTLNGPFKVANDTFESLSDSLQTSIMSLRKVRVDTLFQKVPRIVYSAQADSGKRVEVVTEGGDLFIDKSIIEALDVPLTHLIRNSVDHGIEPMVVRESLGKDSAGTITLRAVEEPNHIVITVEDDGKGLDRGAIREKAEAMELIGYGDPLSDAQLDDLIFNPGLSTAKEVTSVSGRGVGMDSVRTEVESIFGDVRVETQPGKGTRFTLSLPKSITTRIINGFVVEVGLFRVILPMRQVVDTFSFAEKDLVSVVGKEHCVVRNDEVLPMYDLGRMLGMQNRRGKVADDSVLVQLQMPHGKLAMQVDRVVGVQKVVLRDIRGVSNIEFISGGALMGDGSVAFVLDLERLDDTIEGGLNGSR